MKATLSWLSVQPLVVQTAEEGGGWGVSLAHHGATKMNFQLSLCSQGGIRAATVVSITAHGHKSIAHQGLLHPCPCCSGRKVPVPAVLTSTAQERHELLTTAVAQLHLEVMVALVLRDNTEEISNWVISLTFGAWQWFTGGLHEPHGSVCIHFPTTTTSIPIPTAAPLTFSIRVTNWLLSSLMSSFSCSRTA